MANTACKAEQEGSAPFGLSFPLQRESECALAPKYTLPRQLFSSEATFLSSRFRVVASDAALLALISPVTRPVSVLALSSSDVQ